MKALDAGEVRVLKKNVADALWRKGLSLIESLHDLHGPEVAAEITSFLEHLLPPQKPEGDGGFQPVQRPGDPFDPFEIEYDLSKRLAGKLFFGVGPHEDPKWSHNYSGVTAGYQPVIGDILESIKLGRTIRVKRVMGSTIVPQALVDGTTRGEGGRPISARSLQKGYRLAWRDCWDKADPAKLLSWLRRDDERGSLGKNVTFEEKRYAGLKPTAPHSRPEAPAGPSG